MDCSDLAPRAASAPHAPQPLETLFANTARGVFPPADGVTEALARPVGATAATLAFSGHCVVAADVDVAWVARRCPPGELAAAMSAPFVEALSVRVGASPGALDVVLCAPALAGAPVIVLNEPDRARDHPRARRAMRVRMEVRVYRTADGDGVLAIGRGLAGRWEAGFEVQPAARGQGLGRRLAVAARHLIPPGENVFMQVAAGNATSLRAVLAAGFMPIGAEILFGAAREGSPSRG